MAESMNQNGHNNDGHYQTASEKIGQSALLLAVARVSMALALPTLALIFAMGSNYLENKFLTIEEKIATNQSATTKEIENIRSTSQLRDTNTDRVIDKLTDIVGKLSDKMIEVETRQAQEAANFDRFQTAVLLRLDRFQDSQVAMSNAIATLTATLQSQMEAKRRDNILDNPQAPRRTQ